MTSPSPPPCFLQRMDTGGQDTFGLAEPEFQSPTLVPEAARDESAITSLTINYDMGWSNLTSVTGYFWRRRQPQHRWHSVRQRNTSAARCSTNLATAVPPSPRWPRPCNSIPASIRSTKRFDSPPSRQAPDDKWAWIAGLYYSRTRTGLLDNEHIPGFNSTFESTYNDTPLDVLGAAFPDDLVYYAFTEFVNTEKAVFGQATYTHHPRG
jgi:hypothetical protein